jgi:hypothetical protein
MEMQTPESAQLVIDVAQPLGQVERLRKGRAHLRSLARRNANRGVQAHCAARVIGRRDFERTQRLFGACAALLEQG